MKEHDSPVETGADEHWIDALAAYDESLAGGSQDANDPVEDPSECRELAREIECLQLLERIWPRGRRRGDAEHTRRDGWKHGAAADRPATFGKFEIRRPLGYGAHGIVFLAYDPVLHREVALKVPRPDAVMSDELRQRFLREAQAAAALDHPHIVPVHEAGNVGDACYLVEAYCRGPSLAGWLKGRNEPVPAKEAAALVAMLADGVAHAHARGILHRDLKPSNLLLDRRLDADGNGAASPHILGFVPRISDFGLAKLSDAGRDHTASGTLLGTVGYMAPEQAASGEHKIGPSADTYSLGVILYELMTGRAPFLGESALAVLQQVQEAEPVQPRRLRAGIPRDLETICLKCLEKRPCDRYSSAEALAADLRRYLRGEPIDARPISAIQRSWRWCCRHPSLACATFAAGLGMILFALVSASFAWYQAGANERLEIAANRLNTEKQQTQAALERVEQQYIAAQRQSTLASLDRGISLCEQGDVARGMLWLARSLATASALPAGQRGDLDYVIRSNLAAWPEELCPLMMLLPHDAEVESLAFSPDGTIVLADEADGSVTLWNVGTGQQVGTKLKHRENVLCVAFSPCGNFVLTGSSDGMVRLWDVATCQPVGKPIPHSAAVYTVAFDIDGARILTGTDPALRLWETSTRRILQGPLAQPPGAILASRFLPASQRLVTGSWDHRGRLWDVSDEKLIAELPHDGPVCSVALSPDGRRVLTASHDHTARFWDARMGSPVGTPLEHPDKVLAVAFAPDGKTVITHSGDQSLRVWDVETCKKIGKAIALPCQTVEFAVAISPDTNMIATAGRGEEVRLWSRAPARRQSQLALHHPEAARAIACNPDGRLVLTGCMDHAARLWDLATGEQIGAALLHEARVLDVAFSPTGIVLLTCSADRTARLWDAASGKQLAEPLMHPDKVNAVAFHPDGRTVITGCEDGVVRFWGADDGRLLSDRTLPHGSAIQDLSFTPDGSLIIVSEKNSAVRVWDAYSAVELPRHMPHPGNVLKLTVSPDGRTVLSGSNDATARLWDLATREQVGTSLPHRASLHGVAFSPDGRLALSGSNDRTARLWDVASQRPIGPPLLHEHEVSAVAFAADGVSFFTGTRGGTVHVWNLAHPVEDNPETIERWVEVLTGLELDDNGASRRLDFQRWHERCAQIGSRQSFNRTSPPGVRFSAQ
jgi:WD40 repeat protein/serine/threonine protein kinase